MDTLLSIGASKSAVLEAKKSILEIMKVDPKIASDPVKCEALKTLSSLCAVGNTNVSYCHFIGGKMVDRKVNK